MQSLHQARGMLAGVQRRLNRRQEPVASWTASTQPELLEVDKWAASKEVLALQSIIGDHPYPLDELLLMTAVFTYLLPEVVIDIGTHLGKSARIWHELGKLYRTNTTIHTVDILDPAHPEYPGANHAQFVRNTTVKIHIGDGAVIAEKVIRGDANRRYLLFLDGDHRIETVRHELDLARLLTSGGILVHDTFYQPSSTYNHGPYLAIQDFISSFSVKQVLHAHAGLPGMTYLGLQQV